ncbi:MAG: FAD-dependent thymidylate synthase [Candidatus Altiarchaeota archaeon]|nr:FAD-dependent thymidylate synthase [Candidatus Altiarchaeota archaeon]
MIDLENQLELKLIDSGPSFGDFSADYLLAATGLLTLKSGELAETLEKMDPKFVKGFHNEATKRGHASLLTTPVFWFWAKGSRMLDYYGSAWPFGSYLIFSSRRIKITPELLTLPKPIKENPAAKKIYEQAANKMIEIYNELIDDGFSIDEARRALPMGFASSGFFMWPAQVLFGMVKEAERNRWLPEEIKELARQALEIAEKKMPGIFKGSKEIKYDTTYPHRTLFEKPRKMPWTGSKLLMNELDLSKYNSNNMTLDDWKALTNESKSRFIAKLELELSLAAWNDVKRQRTVVQEAETIYNAAERGDIFVPDRVAGNKAGLKKFMNANKLGLQTYHKLKQLVPAPEASYVLPLGLVVRSRLVLNGYHMFDPFGFYGIRLCSHADFEITEQISAELDNLVDKELKSFVGPKCKMGFCPEKEYCASIFKYKKDYDKQKHQIANSSK